MAKTKSVYFCNNCGAESPKWIGKCPVCGEWNSYVEEVVSTKPAGTIKTAYHSEGGTQARPLHINEIKTSEEPVWIWGIRN